MLSMDIKAETHIIPNPELSNNQANTQALHKVRNLAAIGLMSVALFGAESATSASTAKATSPERCTTVVGPGTTTTICTSESAPTEPDDGPLTSPEPITAKPKPPIKSGPSIQRAPRHVSYTQNEKTASGRYKYGANAAAQQCGLFAFANAVTDVTGKTFTPVEAYNRFYPRYYDRVWRPKVANPTHPEGFKVIGNQLGLKVKHSNFRGAKLALRHGGVAIAEFNNAVAIRRTGQRSAFAHRDHDVTISGEKGSLVAIDDPHKTGSRHNERYSNGTRRYWSYRQLVRAGLTHIWTVLPKS